MDNLPSDVVYYSIIPYLRLQDMYRIRTTNVGMYTRYQQCIFEHLQSNQGRAKVLTLALQKQDTSLLEMVLGDIYEEDIHEFFMYLGKLVNVDLKEGSLDLVLAIATNVSWSELSSRIDDYFGWRDSFCIALSRSSELRNLVIERHNIRYLWKRFQVDIFEALFLHEEALLKQMFLNVRDEDLPVDESLLDYVGIYLDIPELRISR